MQSSLTSEPDVHAAASLAAKENPPTADDFARMTPREVRLAMREGRFTLPTTRNVARGHVQCALVVLPQAQAFDFLLYCQRNQRPCPVYEVTDLGSHEPRRIAPGADLRTDLALYHVYRGGRLESRVESIADLWRSDLVAFLIGSNTSCDLALNRAGVQTEKNRWVLRTTVPTDPSGPFSGPLAVTMRWLTPKEAIVATQLTGRFPFNHGAPFHIGDPAAIGADLANPMTGQPVREIPKDVVPVFWACSMTPLEVAIAAKIDLMITCAPSKLFITDIETDKAGMP
jgi:uncharacterized protein YcsI (UPF0317 family)